MTSEPESLPRRWWILATVGLAQLMVVLDSTVVNIALPSMQNALGMSDADRGWAVTAYALAFGGLLLIGGRIADSLGQRRAFVLGLAGFAVASALAGSAGSPWMLFAGRAAQGVFAAVLAPAALSLISTTFTDQKERGVAFGVFGALTGAGAAVGLLLGGVLTEYLSWHWCLLINVPIAVAALFGVMAVVPRSPRAPRRPLDLTGAIMSLFGLLALVFALSEVATRGWSDPVVTGLLVAGVLLLAGFVVREARAAHPLLPLRIVTNRARAGAFLALGLPQISMFGFFLFLTYYLQEVLGFTPIEAGLGFLPLSIAIGIGSTVIAGVLAIRLAPRMLIVPALLAMALGMALLIGLGTESGTVYWTRLLPAELLIGLGLGCVVSPATSIATAGVHTNDIGVASATVNAVQQLGGSVGTALLNTVATIAASSIVGDSKLAAVHGFSVALIVALVVIVATALVVWLVLNVRRPRPVALPQLQEENA